MHEGGPPPRTTASLCSPSQGTFQREPGAAQLGGGSMCFFGILKASPWQLILLTSSCGSSLFLGRVSPPPRLPRQEQLFAVLTTVRAAPGLQPALQKVSVGWGEVRFFGQGSDFFTLGTPGVFARSSCYCAWSTNHNCLHHSLFLPEGSASPCKSLCFLILSASFTSHILPGPQFRSASFPKWSNPGCLWAPCLAA